MIQLHNVVKSFGTNVVLKGIDLDIYTGEIFGLIGKNGAGKTTLLSIIAGLSDATSGYCCVNENKISKKVRSASVGYLPDVPAFFDYMSVCEFIDYLYKKEDGYKQKRNELIKLVGLKEKTIIKTMSRGMRQRLGLAAALVSDPDVLLLDEPSSALDPLGRYELSEILLQLKEQGKTIVLSTHILTDMENICDRVGFLHNGVIVKTLSPNDIQTTQKMKIVFANPINGTDLEGLPFDIIFEDNNTIVLNGDMINNESQKELLKRLYSINNVIIGVTTIGADLDAIFREVCL